MAGGGLSLYYYRNSIASNEQETKQNQILIEDKKITDKEKPFSIEITYPYIFGLDDFNKKAENLANSTLAEFKKISLENDQAVKEIDPESYADYPREYYLSISYDKGLVDENIISIVFNISNFTGGAHGASYFSALNYDIKNKKDLALADLFLGQADYLQKISDFCINDLTKQMKERAGDEGAQGAWIQDGAGPNIDNYSVFLINPSTGSGQATITFYFPQYQVAAYALGDFKVIYPR